MKEAVLVLLALVSAAAFASGAPWYRWQNIHDRTVICSQIKPGEAWVLFRGPFMESNCKKPGYPQ